MSLVPIYLLFRSSLCSFLFFLSFFFFSCAIIKAWGSIDYASEHMVRSIVSGTWSNCVIGRMRSCRNKSDWDFQQSPPTACLRSRTRTISKTNSIETFWDFWMMSPLIDCLFQIDSKQPRACFLYFLTKYNNCFFKMTC